MNHLSPVSFKLFNPETEPNKISNLILLSVQVLYNNVSVLGRDEGYTVKYNPLPEGVPEGEAQGNS